MLSQVTKAKAAPQHPKAAPVAATPPKPPVAAAARQRSTTDENLLLSEAAKKRLLSPEKRAHLADKRTRVHSPKVKTKESTQCKYLGPVDYIP